MTKRENILHLASMATNGDRDKKYGKPENNFDNIARLWNAYFGYDRFAAHDVAMMLALMKVARIKSGHGYTDSYVDAVGYLSIAGELYENGHNTEKAGSV